MTLIFWNKSNLLETTLCQCSSGRESIPKGCLLCKSRRINKCKSFIDVEAQKLCGTNNIQAWQVLFILLVIKVMCCIITNALEEQSACFCSHQSYACLFYEQITNLVYKYMCIYREDFYGLNLSRLPIKDGQTFRYPNKCCLHGLLFNLWSEGSLFLHRHVC